MVISSFILRSSKQKTIQVSINQWMQILEHFYHGPPPNDLKCYVLEVIWTCLRKYYAKWKKSLQVMYCNI